VQRCGHYKWRLQQDGARHLTPPEERENVIHRAEHDIVTTKKPRSESGGLYAVGGASGDGLRIFICEVERRPAVTLMVKIRQMAPL